MAINNKLIQTIIAVTLCTVSSLVKADGFQDPILLVQAIEARAAKFNHGTFKYTRSTVLDGISRKDADTYKAKVDGDKYYVEIPDEIIAHDGKFFYLILPAVKAADILTEFSLEKKSTRVDPRHLGDLSLNLKNYIKKKPSYATVSTFDNKIMLEVNVPKEDLVEALYSWPDPCRDGAKIRILVDPSASLAIEKIEWYGAHGESAGVLGHIEEWKNWRQLAPDIWVPEVNIQQNFAVDHGKQVEYIRITKEFTDYDLDPKFTEQDFYPIIPAGYRVNDRRVSGGVTYLSGGVPEEIGRLTDLKVNSQPIVPSAVTIMQSNVVNDVENSKPRAIATTSLVFSNSRWYYIVSGGVIVAIVALGFLWHRSQRLKQQGKV